MTDWSADPWFAEHAWVAPRVGKTRLSGFKSLRPHAFSIPPSWAVGPRSRADPSRGFKEANFLPPQGIPMPIDRRRLLQVVAILGAVCAYTTIVVGGTVRGTNAGLACPDWPLCNGSVVPNLADTGILVEYIHRLVAALTGIFMLSTLIAAVLWFRPEMRIVTPSIMSFAILVTQVAVGALTIASDNDWVVVTIHLALGTATLASALIVALVSLWPAAPSKGATVG